MFVGEILHPLGTLTAPTNTAKINQSSATALTIARPVVGVRNDGQHGGFVGAQRILGDQRRLERRFEPGRGQRVVQAGQAAGDEPGGHLGPSNVDIRSAVRSMLEVSSWLASRVAAAVTFGP